MKAGILTFLFVSLLFEVRAQVVVTNLEDSGPGSLREAIDEAVSGDVISFSPSLIESGSDSIVLESQITFSKSLRIKGLYTDIDTLYLSGGGSNSVFTIENTTNVYLDSLVIVRGNHDEDGGAISFTNSDSLFISNSQFSFNHTTESGGAIYLKSVDSISVLIDNSVFFKNTAEVRGGGIYIEQTNYATQAFCTAKITESLFDQNYAVSGGGALYAKSFSSAYFDSYASVELYESTISRNNAGGGGGIGVNVRNDFESDATATAYSKVTAFDCVFSENGGNGGGGISSSARSTYKENDTSKVLINNCVFSDNMANWGGGIYSNAHCSTVDFSNSIARGNYAFESGGVISSIAYPFPHIYDVSRSIVSINNSTLEDNYAEVNGGAIFSGINNPSTDHHTASLVTLNQSTLSNNTAEERGGGIYAKTSYNEIETNESTVAFNVGLLEGGGVYVVSPSSFSTSGSQLTINNSTITGNYAEIRGGGVFSNAYTGPSITYGSHIDTKSSIIALNSEAEIHNSNPEMVNSLGYNVFGDEVVAGSVATDQLGADSLALNLLPLDFYGGSTKTMMPHSPSIALNSGDPADGVSAQNVIISGIRDVGAAEFCESTFGTDVVSACDSLVWIDGITYYESNYSAVDTLINAAGCDSIVTLNLSITNHLGVDTHYVCDSLVWIDGITYYADNDTAVFVLEGGSVLGCDSTVRLNLSVFESPDYSDIITACDSLVWINGVTYYEDTDSETFELEGGCTVTLDLTIVHSTEGTDVITSCDSLVWIDGLTYYEDNNVASYLIEGGNSDGCDSLVFLDLTIVNSSFGVDTRVECDTFIWLDGIAYIEDNNTAMFTIEGGAANGCDSLVILNLTMLESAESFDVITACDSLVWIDGNTYTSDNNTAVFNIEGGAANGCDSLVKLDLTILNSVTVVDERNECDSLIWIDGFTYYESTDTIFYRYVGGAANGCDSIVQLNLNIQRNDMIDVQHACDTYEWIDGVVYTEDENDASMLFTNELGCDSLVELNLTVDYTTSSVATISSCTDFTWIDGNTYTTSNYEATHVLINEAGCDSVITLNLTINEVEATINAVGELLEANDSEGDYQWVDCNDGFSEIAGENTQFFEYTTNGSYAVIVSESGCADTSDCYLIEDVGLFEEIGGSNLVRLYPNPTKEEVTVYWNQPASEGTVVIFNSLGMEVMSGKIEGDVPLKINLTGESGVYFVRIISESGTQFNLRVVKCD